MHGLLHDQGQGPVHCYHLIQTGGHDHGDHGDFRHSFLFLLLTTFQTHDNQKTTSISNNYDKAIIPGQISHSPSNTISLLSTEQKMEDNSAFNKKTKCKLSMDKTSKKSVSQDFDKVMKSKLKQNKNFSTSKTQNTVKSKYKSLDSLLDKEKTSGDLSDNTEYDLPDENKEEFETYVDMSRSTLKDQDSDSMVYQVVQTQLLHLALSLPSLDHREYQRQQSGNILDPATGSGISDSSIPC